MLNNSTDEIIQIGNHLTVAYTSRNIIAVGRIPLMNEKFLASVDRVPADLRQRGIVPVIK